MKDDRKIEEFLCNCRNLYIQVSAENKRLICANPLLINKLIN